MTISDEAAEVAPLRVPFDPEERAKHEASAARLAEHAAHIELTRRHR